MWIYEVKTKVGILSLGCPRNLVDSEVMLGLLKEAGFDISDSIKACDVAIINTCSFIEDATQESIDTIFDLAEFKKEGSLKAIVVAGCLPQRFKEDIAKELKEIDCFIGTGELGRIVEVVKSSLVGERTLYISDNPTILYDHHSPKYLITPSHYAYVKISEGCKNSCTYCIVPKLKGKYRSRTIKSVVEEVKMLSEKKEVVEINLVAQDTTSYGIDLYGRPNLSVLLEELAKVKKSGWIRFLYSHPAHFSDELIYCLRDTTVICKYVDLPLEHVNDIILKKMGRQITKKEIITLIEKLRKEIKRLTIRTSFIVGFPGETDEQFKELIDFIHDIKFERLGAFIYSREESTPAFNFPNQIPDKIKKSRFNELMSIQQEISKELNETFLGKDKEVLIDEKDENESNLFIGRTEGDAPEVDGLVYVRAKTAKPGDFLKVKIVDTCEYDLVGEEII